MPNAEGNLVFVDAAGNKKAQIHTDNAGSYAMQFQAWNNGPIDFHQNPGTGPAVPTGTGNVPGGSSRLFINSSGNIGIGTETPGADKLDVRGRAYSSGGWQTTDADYAEWFEKEEDAVSGDIIGINLANGKARKYQFGDKLVGVCSANPAMVGNRLQETDKEMSKTHILVGLLGQLDFDQNQVVIENRIVKTKDGKEIGVLLSNGKILVGR